LDSCLKLGLNLLKNGHKILNHPAQEEWTAVTENIIIRTTIKYGPKAALEGRLNEMIPARKVLIRATNKC
jgi:hypothetical protein